MTSGTAFCRGWSRLIFPALAVALALQGCAARLPPTDEAAKTLLIGNWYGEMACESCGDSDFNLLRWTRMNSADGKQRVHFRYYRDGKIRQNVIRLGRWGYRAGTYWLVCEAYHVDGKAQACPDDRYEFVVESLNERSMAYRIEKYGVRYTARRVSDDYRLTD